MSMTPPRLRIESQSIGVVNSRRAAWARRIAVVMGWIVCQALLSAFAPATAACWGTLLAFSALALLVGSLRGDPTAGVVRRGKPGVVTVEDDALHIQAGGRTRIIARAQVVAGWTEEGPGGGRVVLQTSTGTVVAVDVKGAEAGQALLEALGVAPDQRAVAIRVGLPQSAGNRFIIALVGLFFLSAAVPFTLGTALFAVEALRRASGGFAGLGVMAILALITGFVSWLCLQALAATTLRIGTDGVSIHRLGRRRFVPRADLAGVGAYNATLVLDRREAKPIVVTAAGREEAAALARRVEEALSVHKATAPAEALAALDRSGRPIGEWKRAIATLLGESAGYRRAGLGAEDLMGIVEDGAARPERRVAAAAALAARGDEEAKSRVRIAAEACVSDRLRIAIARAADGEIDEDALAAAEAEATRRA